MSSLAYAAHCIVAMRDDYDIENSNIKSIEYLDDYEDMMDITVEDAHCYYANGLLTHNSGQELRIMTNLSKEPMWEETFLSGGDLHRCYTDDTLFLTDGGFKLYDSIGEDDLLAQYCDGELSYTKYLARHESSSSELYSIKAKSSGSGRTPRGLVDLVVSGNHRILCSSNPNVNSFKEYTAKELIGRKCIYVPVSGVLLGGEEHTSGFSFVKSFRGNRWYNSDVTFDSDTFIEFLGFWLGDGHAKTHICKGGHSYRVSIAQSQSSKKQYAWVSELNRRMGEFFSERVDTLESQNKRNTKKATSDFSTFEANHISLVEYLEREFLSSGEKRIPRWVYGLSLRQRELFLQAFIRADGHKSKRTVGWGMLFTSLEGLSRDLEELAFINGYRTHRYPFNGMHNIGITKNSKYCRVSVEELKVSAPRRLVSFSVDSTYLVVKRGMGISISGNSMALKMCKVRNKEYTKEDRKDAKSINFGYAYGMTADSFAQKKHIPLEEAEIIFKAYEDSIPHIIAFQKRCIEKGRKEGTSWTCFGFPRRIKYWFDSPNRAMRSFGERTCKNFPIQGAGADIIKMALLKTYNKIVCDRSRNIRMYSQIHDEGNFGVPEETAVKDALDIWQAMRIDIPNWKVPMVVGLEIGHSFGLTIPFNPIVDESGKPVGIIPAWEELSEADIAKLNAPKEEVKEIVKEEPNEATDHQGASESDIDEEKIELW